MSKEAFEVSNARLERDTEYVAFIRPGLLEISTGDQAFYRRTVLMLLVFIFHALLLILQEARARDVQRTGGA